MDIVELPGHTDFEWAVQLNRFGLKLLGLWPEETANFTQDRLNSNLRLFGAIIIMTCICTIPLVHMLLKIWGDLTAMMENFVFTLPMLTLSVKLLILWWKQEALSSLVIMIAQDWIKPKTKDERNVMIRRAQNARLIIMCTYTMIISSLTILILIPAFGYNLRYATNITGTKRPLPLQGYHMYDTSVSPQFELTFVVQSISLLLAALSYTSTDNFLALLVFHICGQLENLTSRMYRMRKSKDFTVELKINVTNHIRLIRFVAIIEDSFTLALLLIFLYFGIIFCANGFIIITIIFDEENVSMKRAIFFIMIICTMLSHICIYCAVGELLVTKYEEVYNAIYEFEWYNLKMKEARNLILLLIHMNKPLYITAGKIFPMSMPTFCSILKTSGGYISVLLASRN